MSSSPNSSFSPNDDHSDEISEPPRDDTVASTEYALRCREFLELLRDLNNMGTDTYFDMPRITVIGGQSTGKSSLVEAVSGIHVPRDSGTCTRCPMECSMSSNADVWSCQITLHYSVDANGLDLTMPDRVPFGPLITEEGSVELWLRRAQASILSPHVADHTEFYSKTLQELQDAMRTDENVLPFSKNAIQVEVKDPRLTDLSFIDLPGLIQNSEADVINLVRELVESHISGENTVILVAIPMSDDIENQQAVRLAKEADPIGERTIGVLTKPDTLTTGASGAKKRWMDILRGSQHQLKRGYYCVRLPDDDERSRSISRSDSSIISNEFFNSTAPWNSITSLNLFGVRNLVSNLSSILVSLIEKSLPDLKRTIDEQLGTCHVELGKLPPPLTNDPATEFLLGVNNFCADFRNAVFGESHKEDLVQYNRKQYEEFKSAIYSTCPDFRPFENYTMHRNPAPDLAGPAKFSRPPVDLRTVQKVINASIGWELPGYVPFQTMTQLVAEITDQWKAPTHACFEKIFRNSTRVIDSLIQKRFGRFKFLNAHISSVIRIELDRIKAQALQAVDTILLLEHNPIFTQNTDFLASEKQKWSLSYTNIRRNSSRYLIHTDPDEVEFEDEQDEVNSTDDELQQALSMMVDVRAYFQVTYKRIIDYIPLVIEHALHQSAWANFETSLFQSLPKGHQASERTKALLSDDPAISRARSFLTNKKERLTKIQCRLDEFGDSIGKSRLTRGLLD